MTELSNKLIENLDWYSQSKGGRLLFFDKEPTPKYFIDHFSIPQNCQENFKKAFEIVTNGQGEEKNKINSIESSSLLSLMTFYPLFNNEDKSVSITIDGVPYYRCFFEVRNRVINFPSCVDVVLVSTDDKKMLFLESKLSEYAYSLKSYASYGIGYKRLYETFEYVFKGYLEIGESQNKLILKSNSSTKIYIEGVKQTISHLIGIMKGPQFRQYRG